ncbi:MAG: hypothetical protein IKH16_08245 [Selenomonadaceae bacterium]|nr:hypothetical protein [Selenomonadaceae bacterium]
MKPGRKRLISGFSTSTVFDDVYRTIAQKLSHLIIPAINEAFGTHYNLRTDIAQLRNEHLELAGKIITDSIFRIGKTLYHLECQSTPDGTMAIRMFEYDFAIALEEARKGKSPYHVRFPLSAVIYLRQGVNATDTLSLEVEFPDQQSVTYKVPVLHVQQYSLKEIFEKDLWLFLPFYIMRYEKQFRAMEKDSGKREALLSELRQMTEKLAEYAKSIEQDSTYTDLMQLTKRIADYMLKEHPTIKKEANHIMGGKILELHSEKIFKKGRRSGLIDGRTKGRAEGRTEGEGRLSRLMSLLLKSGKTEEAIAATESEEIRKELYEKYGIV